MEPPVVEFENCPRCNGSWSPLDHRSDRLVVCIACDLRWIIIDDEECSLVWRSPLKQDHHLGWNFHTHECIYTSLAERINDKETHLPWLPFSITTEQLKLYLLFS